MLTTISSEWLFEMMDRHLLVERDDWERNESARASDYGECLDEEQYVLDDELMHAQRQSGMVEAGHLGKVLKSCGYGGRPNRGRYEVRELAEIKRLLPQPRGWQSEPMERSVAEVLAEEFRDAPDDLPPSPTRPPSEHSDTGKRYHGFYHDTEGESVSPPESSSPRSDGCSIPSPTESPRGADDAVDYEASRPGADPSQEPRDRAAWNRSLAGAMTRICEVHCPQLLPLSGERARLRDHPGLVYHTVRMLAEKYDCWELLPAHLIPPFSHFGIPQWPQGSPEEMWTYLRKCLLQLVPELVSNPSLTFDSTRPEHSIWRVLWLKDRYRPLPVATGRCRNGAASDNSAPVPSDR